jgi:hypothetical protein
MFSFLETAKPANTEAATEAAGQVRTRSLRLSLSFLLAFPGLNK